MACGEEVSYQRSEFCRRQTVLI